MIQGEINEVLQPSCIPRQQQQQLPTNKAVSTTPHATIETVETNVNTTIQQQSPLPSIGSTTHTATPATTVEKQNGLQLNQSLNFPEDNDDNEMSVSIDSAKSSYTL